MTAEIARTTDVTKYLFLLDKKSCMLQSGLVWTRKTTRVAKALESTPIAVHCPATCFGARRQRNNDDDGSLPRKRCKTENVCGKIVSSIGPYCEEHSIAYDNLYVGPSNIDNRIRGLFACASPYNVVELRQAKEQLPLRKLSKREYVQYTNRSKPIFVAGDVISHFGGIFSITTNNFPQYAEDIEQSDTASYLLRYKDHDLLTGKQLFIVVDGCIESSGVARFGNSSIHQLDRSLGEEHVNSEISTMEINEKHDLKVGKYYPSLLPCLVAQRAIYHNDEIILNYGSIYWTEKMLTKLSPAVQDYLFGRSDIKPPFFAQ